MSFRAVTVVALLVAMVAAHSEPSGPSHVCINFCRDPRQPHNIEHSICCDPKPGECPAVRSVCPQFQFSRIPFEECDHDFECLGLEKCCLDSCLPHKICKFPIPH